MTSQEIKQNADLKTDAAASREKLGTQKNNRRKIFILFLGVLILGFLGVGSAFYCRTFALMQNTQIGQLQNKITLLQQQFQRQEALLQNQAQVIQQWHALLQKASLTRERNVVAVFNAQYFFRLASEQFSLSNNLPRALYFLNQAQNELDQSMDTQILPLKQALEQDIATLKKLSWVNLTDLYVSLISLDQEIEKIPLVLIPAQLSASPTINDDEIHPDGWRKGLQQIQHALRQMITIYHLPSTAIPPFITPDQGAYVYQNMHARLSDAAWAVLHRDAKVYQASLAQAIEWMGLYFSQTTPQAKTVLSKLLALQAIVIQPEEDIVLIFPKVFQDYLKTVPAV